MSQVYRVPEGETYLVYRHRRTSSAQVPEGADHEEAGDRLGGEDTGPAGRRGMVVTDVSIWCVVTV